MPTLNDIFPFDGDIYDRDPDRLADPGTHAHAHAPSVDTNESGVPLHLRDYASCYWPEHFRACPLNNNVADSGHMIGSESLMASVMKLLPSSFPAMEHWIHRLPPTFPMIDFLPRPGDWTALVAAAFFGHLSVLKFIRASGKTEEYGESLSRAGLSASYMYGQREVHGDAH